MSQFKTKQFHFKFNLFRRSRDFIVFYQAYFYRDRCGHRQQSGEVGRDRAMGQYDKKRAPAMVFLWHYHALQKILVREHAKYAEVYRLPLDDIISLIISSRCNIKQLTDMWALRRNLTLKDILIDCEAYQRKEKAPKEFDKFGQK